MILNRKLIAIVLLFFFETTTAQKAELKLSSDTIYWQIPELNLGNFMLFSELDSVTVFNNDVAKDQQFTFVLSSGTARNEFKSSNTQKLSLMVDITKGGSSKKLNVLFWPDVSTAHYDGPYKLANSGKCSFEIPEVYELCNIAMCLSVDENNKSYPILYNSDYYKEIQTQFSAFREHPLILLLKEALRKNGNAGFYSICADGCGYSFDKQGHLIQDKPYRHLGNRISISDNIRIWEDFAKASNFRSFYDGHLAFYTSTLEETQNALDFKDARDWMETKTHHVVDAYKFVISPLASYYYKNYYFCEINFCELLFLSQPFNKNSTRNVNEHVSKFLYLSATFLPAIRIYLNDIEKKDSLKINEVFSDLDTWAEVGREAFSMAGANMLFKEYMAQALFLLYVKDKDSESFKTVKFFRDKYMKQRGFKKFENFCDIVFNYFQSTKTGFFDSLPKLLDEFSAVK